MGFDDVVGVDVGIWRAEECQHGHGSCAGGWSYGDVVVVDGIITAASH